MTDSAVVHGLQFTFRHRFLNGVTGGDSSGRRTGKEKEGDRQMRRGKKGNGITNSCNSNVLMCLL